MPLSWIDTLAEQVGSRERALTVLRVWLEQVAPRLAGLITATAAGSTDEVRSIAHTIYGATSMLGMREVAVVCERIANAAPEGGEADLALIAALVDELIAEVGLVVVQVREVLAAAESA